MARPSQTLTQAERTAHAARASRSADRLRITAEVLDSRCRWLAAKASQSPVDSARLELGAKYWLRAMSR